MPSLEKLAAFVEAVRATGLLRAAEMDALAQVAAEPNADAEAILRDVVKRGLLTAYQVRRLWKGRGDDLFLNQYVLLDRLGEGGMGEVFRARHTRLDREVALKVMRKEKMAKPQSVKRFHREIRAAATLAHENVRRVDLGRSSISRLFSLRPISRRSAWSRTEERSSEEAKRTPCFESVHDGQLSIVVIDHSPSG